MDGVEAGVDIARLRRHVDAFRLRYGIPAVAVRIRRASRPVLDYDSGLACLDKRTPAGPRTLYAIGSITKQFVAATALELQRRRDLDLAMPVRDMLASSHIGEQVTLSHLLSHTSGIVYDVGATNESSPTLASVVECVAIDARPPGEHWFYCNTNYYLAGQALQLVMGASLSQLVAEVIPGDLRASFRFDGVPPTPCRAAGHAPTANGFGTIAPPDGRSFGSGSAYATASMLVDWVTRLWSGEILNAESAEIMSRRTVLADGTEADYGMGCFSTRSGIVELSHDGNTAGFSSQVSYYPEFQLAICVLANCQPHVAEELEKRLRAAMIEVTAQPLSISAPERESPLKDLEGYYGIGSCGADVAVAEGELRLVSPSGRLVQLVRRQGDRFVERTAHSHGYEYQFGLHPEGRDLQIRRGHKLLFTAWRQARPGYSGA